LDTLEKMVPSTYKIEEKIQDIKSSISQIKNESGEIQKKIEGLEQQKIIYSEQGNMRLEMLRKYHYDSYQGVLWLRKNKDIFKDEILEPSYLHLTIKKEYSEYVEAFLSFQALSFFIVKNDEDFSKLTRILKDELNFSVNVAILNFRETTVILKSDLENYGLEGVLSDFIDCRREYIDFLNSYGHFNCIPISRYELGRVKKVTEQDIFNILPMVKRMAIAGRYSEIKRSKYNNDFIIISNRIFSKGLFNFPKINIQSIISQLEILNKERELNKLKMDKILESKGVLEGKRNILRREFDISAISKLLCYLVNKILNLFAFINKI